MIGEHDPMPEVGVDPYIEPASYQTESHLSTIEEHLERIANFSERQREKEAPTLIDLGPVGGLQAAQRYTTTQKLRVQGIIMGGPLTGVGAISDYRLLVGSRPFHFFGNVNLQYIPFPISIERGTDIAVADIVNAGNVTWTFILIAYPE